MRVGETMSDAGQIDWRVIFNKYRGLIDEAEGGDYLPASFNDVGHYPPFEVPEDDRDWQDPYRYAGWFTREEWLAIFEEKKRDKL